MKKEVFYLGVFVFLMGIFVFSGSEAEAQMCVPEYVCEDWGACIDGVERRTCVDVNCEESDITERRLCEGGCVPDVVCGDWSECRDLEGFEDILRRDTKITIFSERTCVDRNQCIEDYNETARCTQVPLPSFESNFERREIFGENYFVGVNSETGEPFMMINIDSWQSQGRLDISFVQAEPSHPRHCYNGRQDGDEDGVDCGGSCKECVEDRFSVFDRVRMQINRMLF